MSFSFVKLLSAIVVETGGVKNTQTTIIIFGTVSRTSIKPSQPFSSRWFGHHGHVIFVIWKLPLKNRRTSKDSLDTSKSAPHSLPRILNFLSNSPSVLPGLFAMIIQWKHFADEIWNQILLSVHLQVDHDFTSCTNVWQTSSSFSPSWFHFFQIRFLNWNFYFLGLSFTFTLINRFRHRPVLVSVKENLGRIHVGYTHTHTHTSKPIPCSRSFFWMRFIFPRISSQ